MPDHHCHNTHPFGRGRIRVSNSRPVCHPCYLVSVSLRAKLTSHRVVTSLSLIVANVPRIMRFVGMGGSGMLYPQITETEIVLSARTASDGASRVVGEPLVSMDCKQDENTSTSSPCEHQDGVMMCQEVKTEAKDSDNAD
jgi:hypothetical protein